MSYEPSDAVSTKTTGTLGTHWDREEPVAPDSSSSLPIAAYSPLVAPDGGFSSAFAQRKILENVQKDDEAFADYQIKNASDDTGNSSVHQGTVQVFNEAIPTEDG